jgi:hypothetical protein
MGLDQNLEQNMYIEYVLRMSIHEQQLVWMLTSKVLTPLQRQTCIA